MVLKGAASAAPPRTKKAGALAPEELAFLFRRFFALRNSNSSDTLLAEDP